jgi:hypothetical protein
VQRAEVRVALTPTAALGIEILPYDVEVGDVARKHTVEGRLAAEKRCRVWLANPCVSGVF